MAEQKTAQAHLTITDITDGVNANIWTTSTAPTTPNYTFTISNLTGSTDKPRIGDIILQGVYRYTITSVSSTTVLAGSRQSLQGASGAAGGKWYTGTGITGTSTTATIFSGSGVSSAVVGDMYLNTSTDNVYRCTVAGAASAAKWVYTGNIKGSQGNAGKSVTKVETEYYRRLSGGAAPTASSTGSTTIPDYVDGCTYYTRTITYFNTGDPDKSSWIENSGLTNENKNAYDAWIAAGNAELKAKPIIQNSSGVTVASGINGADVNPDNISTYGYNTIMAPNYLGLRYNAINLAKLTTTGTAPALEFYIPTMNNSIPVQGNKGMSISGTALTFYNPSDNKAQLIIGANGTLQSGNYNRGTDSKFSSNGTKIDLVNGDIITKYFRISQGLETGLNAGAYIHGTVEALEGRIGADSTNYWEISKFTDYNLSSNATIVGHGGSFIQLGDSSTWRLATNRIHTGWYTSGDTVLHYPDINSKYWDFGIHAPTTTTEKFLYIRSSKNNTSTSNILQNLLYDIDDTYATSQWNYKFYIDASGSVHSPSYYIINDDGSEQTLSGSGLVASSLSCGTVGSLTQPIYFNNGVPATTTYALNAAGAKGVITNIAENASSTDLPTTAAVVSYVTSRGYITTDNKVLTELASNNTTFYIAGPINTATTTGTLKVITDAKITVNSSGKATITATTFSGSLSGTASRATADSDGNTIKTTYLKLSGGNVTGPVTFGSSVSADELTAGNLVVNGAASFTNNLQVNTINGVSVGSSPKFTDTVTTVTVTGNGNAITAASASNGVVTLTKGTTFLTSYTETDPIFVASAAHEITSSDISNWNSKTSNTGTVTSVRVQASSPLQSSTSTAQSSTLNTTISFVNQNKNLVLAGPSSGNAAAPTFRSLVAADIPNLSWNKITSDKPTTLSGYGITDAAGSNAIVGLSASSNSAGVTTFTATRASGTNPLSFEVSIVASAATGASALKDSNGLISKGSETKPVYFSNGVPAEANTYAGGTAVTLNGSGKGASTASFYAPTTAGTTSQVLIGGGNAPTWTNISDLVPSSAASATYATYDASESSNTTKTTIANKYVKKSGDTMTNILTLYREGTTANNYPAGIKFSVKDTTTGQTYSNAFIYAYQDHNSTTYGTNMVIHSGGGMFIGSGESPANHYSAKGASYTGEEIYITSDGGIYIQSNGNTIANRVGLYINASHEVVPIKADVLTNNIGSIGTSTYKWANIYATTFYGALSGNASTATSLNGGTALSSKNLNDYHDTSGKLNYYYAGGSNSCTNVPIGDGTQFGMVTYNSAGSHVTQELSSFSSATNKGKWIRWYQNSTWTDWEKFLTSVNYSDYTVTKTGGGASGTWGISISGNAANVSGTVTIGHGGTGATTAATARSNLGTWSLVSDSYNTLMPADGTTNGWIKFGTSNTSYGILPSAAGNAGSGHNYIGTSNWYWKYAYIDQIYGYLNGSISGNAATTTKSGISTIWLYPENSNEINIGGTSTSSMIYFGYRAKDSRPIPNKIIFGGSTGSTELQASSFNMINKANMYYDSTLEAIVFSFA